MPNWILTLLACSIFAIATIVWWRVPRHQAAKLERHSDLTSKDIAELEDEYRKTITQALGGAILLLSAALAFEQLNESARKSDSELRQSTLELNQKAAETDINNKRQLLISGIELLSQAKSSQHIGGIQILEDWANSPSKDATSTEEGRFSIVIPTIANFVRDQTHFHIQDERCEQFDRPKSEQIGSDVQAALNVLKRRSRTASLTLDFRGLNLSRANLSGADLSGSSFAFADLSQANLSNTKLRNADLYCANLYRANLSGSDLSGDSINENEPHTNLAGALLIRANFGKWDGNASNLARTIMVKADLSQADLQQTDLRGAQLWAADLFQTTLMQVKIDNQTDLHEACLVETRNSDTPLERAKNYDETVRAVSAHELAIESWCGRYRSHIKQE